jgi:transportin-1
MLRTVSDTDESVAMEACEFWSALAGDDRYRNVVSNQLSELLPLLISRLTLSEAQLQRERADAEAEATGDKKLDFKPVHRRAGSSEEGSAEVEAQWTLRMEAALLLDNIGLSFDPSIVLRAALPSIETCLKDSDVWRREAGMLALGALSKGCMDALGEYLPQLFPFFLQVNYFN